MMDQTEVMNNLLVVVLFIVFAHPTVVKSVGELIGGLVGSPGMLVDEDTNEPTVIGLMVHGICMAVVLHLLKSNNVVANLSA
tara:strand:+ start:10127 stop:10372 length:246 start_codon:yes stop_codon:yes gene_type:complete